MIQLVTRSPGKTRSLGEAIGATVDKPVMIALSGDLGCGKTTFVQGLARGLGVSENEYVTSPTFTLINEYQGRLALVHVDLYRLETVPDMLDIGLDEALESDGVIAVEWADKLPFDDFLPDVSIHIDMMEHHARKFTFTPLKNRFSTTIIKWNKKQI